MNSFEYDTVIDFEILADKAPLDNVESLMNLASKFALTSPWPQVVEIGRALSWPLSDADRASLLPLLQWPRLTSYVPIDPQRYM
jgi:hypothetical protein